MTTRNIITELTISEISGVRRPAQSAALAKIVKSETTPADDLAARFFADMAKSKAAEIHKSEELKMTENDPTNYGHNSAESHYSRLIEKTAERLHVSKAKAHSHLMENDPQAVAEAYSADEQQRVRALSAEAERTMRAAHGG